MRLVLAVLLVCLAEKGEAQTRWRTLYADTNVTIAVDTASIIATDVGERLVWMRYEWTRDQRLSNGTIYRVSKSHDLVNCSASRYKSFTVVFNDSNGSVVHQFDTPDGGRQYLQWSPFVPDTVGEAASRTFCKGV